MTCQSDDFRNVVTWNFRDNSKVVTLLKRHIRVRAIFIARIFRGTDPNGHL